MHTNLNEGKRETNKRLSAFREALHLLFVVLFFSPHFETLKTGEHHPGLKESIRFS